MNYDFSPILEDSPRKQNLFLVACFLIFFLTQSLDILSVVVPRRSTPLGQQRGFLGTISPFSGGSIYWLKEGLNGNRTNLNRARSGETSRVTQYAYDKENRLTNLTYINNPPAGIPSAQFTYNGDGRRTKAVEGTVTTNYLYDGTEAILEKDGTSATQRTYNRAPGFPGGIGGMVSQRKKVSVTTGNGKNKVTTLVDKNFYSHYDALGSIANITDETGAKASSYEYDAFGNAVASSDTINNTYQFSTKEFESHAKLTYFGARYYDSEIGRWLTPDPLGMVDGTNRYLYVNNNPINLIDPYGLMGERLSWSRVGNILADNLKQTPARMGQELIDIFNWPSNYPEEAISLLLFSGAPYEGQVVYRLSGGTSSKMGSSMGASWTPTNPLIWGENAANKLGLPKGNTQEILSVGKITDPTGITVKAATALDGNAGGAIEYVVPNVENKIKLVK